MFYSNENFKDNAKEIISEIDKMVESVKDIKGGGKIESELKFSLVLKSTGNIELYFDDIMSCFAKENTSKLFHNYFQNNFTKAGKNVSPEIVNRLLKNLKVPTIGKKENPKAYTSLDSLYKIRNAIAHGESNITETYDDIKEYIKSAMNFMDLIITKLDSVMPVI